MTRDATRPHRDAVFALRSIDGGRTPSDREKPAHESRSQVLPVIREFIIGSDTTPGDERPNSSARSVETVGIERDQAT
ncbi:hypothetical protein C488_04058 [Natrinema pellirubrum DSM 15624]|uniref:Uncharacterized protein n=1 Tax=Natrinema pellirubrum (strain DSM 15624 / CIP 106293 / JCM 10476 / NCIMB 786 / 157) TaxID=797303 RepID=L9Z5C0_NATP1|nr:hypothetical protein C488_04058 [Natrinema pellirubrum DSM 15624]